MTNLKKKLTNKYKAKSSKCLLLQKKCSADCCLYSETHIVHGLPLLVFERQTLPVTDFLVFRWELRHHLCVHVGDLWKPKRIRSVLTKSHQSYPLLQFCPMNNPTTDKSKAEDPWCASSFDIWLQISTVRLYLLARHFLQYGQFCLLTSYHDSFVWWTDHFSLLLMQSTCGLKELRHGTFLITDSSFFLDLGHNMFDRHRDPACGWSLHQIMMTGSREMFLPTWPPKTPAADAPVLLQKQQEIFHISVLRIHRSVIWFSFSASSN